MAIRNRAAVEGRERGLPSLNASRLERRRAIILGRVRVRGMPPHFWLWTMALLGAFGVIYWKVAQGRLEDAKAAVMAKQRAVAASLGPKLLPFRDAVEGRVRELAGPWEADFVAPSTDVDAVAKAPGVYLRLRLANASSPASIREAASHSLHDGFTSCFFVRPARDPRQGPACRASADCEPGHLCNEWNVCNKPVEPYNLRLAYRALRVLSSDWSDELHAAESELGVNGYERDLEGVTRTDVPIAIDVFTRAKYLTVVLDEEPKQGLPPPIGDEGDETAEERLQRVPHAARVGIWRLGDGQLLAKLRLEAAGELLPISGQQPKDPESLAAARRQANSCALAVSAKRALSPAAAGAAAPAASDPAAP